MSAVAAAPAPPSLPKPGAPKTSFHRKQFRFSSFFFSGLTGLATLLILAFLVIIFGNILMLGWQGFSWRFITAGTEADMFDVNKAGVFPMIDIPIGHPIFHMLYDVKGVAQIPAIGLWENTGRTWEREDAQVPHARIIQDRQGHVLVLITHNTDYSDAFEREGESRVYFERFAGLGYAFGINALLYAMTH